MLEGKSGKYMEKSIRIIYDIKQNVRFSFWKYFFEMTGIWVNAEQYDGTRFVVKNENEKTLLLLSGRSEWIASDKWNRNCFYILKARSRVLVSRRQDLCTMDFENKDKCAAVIHWLFRTDPQKEKLLEMYVCYGKYNLWKYLWLFQEFSYSEGDIDRWAEEITAVCGEFLREFEFQWNEMDNSYVSYACLYLEYIQLAMKSRSRRLLSDDVEDLLLKGQRMARKWGAMPALNILLGRICSLSVNWSHWSESYYLKALAVCGKMEHASTYELKYKVGRIYEKNYGDWGRAVRYYHQSLRENHRFYRAIYKLGIEAEREESWENAVDCYRVLEQSLLKDWSNKQISIKTLEYLCKVWNRLGDVYQTYLLSPVISRFYFRKLQGIDDDLTQCLERIKRGDQKVLKEKENWMKKFSSFFKRAGFSREDQIWLIQNLKKKVHEVNC